MKRARTPRGMAELSGFRLSSPDTVFGAATTPSLFGDDVRSDPSITSLVPMTYPTDRPVEDGRCPVCQEEEHDVCGGYLDCPCCRDTARGDGAR